MADGGLNDGNNLDLLAENSMDMDNIPVMKSSGKWETNQSTRFDKFSIHFNHFN